MTHEFRLLCNRFVIWLECFLLIQKFCPPNISNGSAMKSLATNSGLCENLGLPEILCAFSSFCMTSKILMTTQNMQRKKKFKEKKTWYACLQHGWLMAGRELSDPRRGRVAQRSHYRNWHKDDLFGPIFANCLGSTTDKCWLPGLANRDTLRDGTWE